MKYVVTYEAGVIKAKMKHHTVIVTASNRGEALNKAESILRERDLYTALPIEIWDENDAEYAARAATVQSPE